MQDYLIFHPERQPIDADCEVMLPCGTIEHRRQKIWVDKVCKEGRKNEDPFVWHKQWLYSFCHATQLVRKHRGDGLYVREGSRLFFCESAAAKRGYLKVDTVFVVHNSHLWKVAGAELPDEFSSFKEGYESAVWNRHLQHGIRYGQKRGHTGKFTYTALNGEHASFLPLTKSGEVFEIPAVNLWGTEVNLEPCVPIARSSYPKKLTTTQADTLYHKCQSADLRVLSATAI